jgi:hypothetical protein
MMKKRMTMSMGISQITMMIINTKMRTKKKMDTQIPLGHHRNTRMMMKTTMKMVVVGFMYQLLLLVLEAVPRPRNLKLLR